MGQVVLSGLMVGDGLITLERVEVLAYRGTPPAEHPAPGPARSPEAGPGDDAG